MKLLPKQIYFKQWRDALQEYCKTAKADSSHFFTSEDDTHYYKHQNGVVYAMPKMDEFDNAMQAALFDINRDAYLKKLGEFVNLGISTCVYHPDISQYYNEFLEGCTPLFQFYSGQNDDAPDPPEPNIDFEVQFIVDAPE